AGPSRGGRKKGAPARTCTCGRRLWDKGRAGRNLLTAAGDVRLHRRYLVCPGCGASRYPLDERLGVAGFVSPQAKKLLTLAGARVLFGGIETAAHFGPRIRRWAARLGVARASAVTVLADGAAWIWEQAARQLPGAAGLLDIYHACEHLAAAGQALYGEGTAE